MIRTCVKCGVPTESVMSYDYASRQMWLDDLVTLPLPPGAGYPLCEVHANRMSPPVGWMLRDRRDPVRPLFSAPVVA